MHGNEARRNEPVRGALDAHLPAFVVVDERHRIQRARGRLHRRDDPPRLAGWLDAPATLGDLFGCINTVIEQRPCGQTSRCRFCALQQMVDHMRAHDEDGDAPERPAGTGPRPEVLSGLFERTCVVEGRPVTRRLVVSARAFGVGRRGPDAPMHMLVSLREAPPED